MSVKLLKQNAISNPNLLINGDFQVWQRGEAFTDKTQLVNKYTADRWRVNHKNLTSTLRILKNSLSYGMYIDKKNTSGEVDICQILECADLYLNKDLTVSINVLIGGKEITDTYTIKLTSSTTEQMKSNSQYYFGFRYSSSTNQLAIAFGIKAVVDCSVNWIKLEIGEIPTKNVPKPYAEEILLCSRYFRIETVTSVLYRQDNGYNYYRLITNNRFRAIPATNWISCDIQLVGDVPIYSSMAINEKGEGVILIATVKAGTSTVANVMVQYDAEIY